MGLDNRNCRAQTLLTLEVLYLYCSLWACNFSTYVTGYAKRDHSTHFIKIELLTPLECAICGEWNGTIDALI